jgi:hypothetical protein
LRLEAVCSPKRPSDHQDRWRASCEIAEKKQLHQANLQVNENRVNKWFIRIASRVSPVVDLNQSWVLWLAPQPWAERAHGKVVAISAHLDNPKPIAAATQTPRGKRAHAVLAHVGEVMGNRR